MKNEKLMHTGPDHTTLRDTYLPKHSGDRKYVEKMVPGYTGKDSLIPTYYDNYDQFCTKQCARPDLCSQNTFSIVRVLNTTT